MYKADRSFMKKLKVLDPKLDCVFNRDTEKFNITFQRATGKAVPIIQVSSEYGGYRQPDRRELTILGDSDMEKHSRRKHLNKASKYAQDYREKSEKDDRSNIRDMTKDGKIQLKQAFGRLAGAGKENATFRRIERKSKGKVF
jgi:hypothetical protein